MKWLTFTLLLIHVGIMYAINVSDFSIGDKFFLNSMDTTMIVGIMFLLYNKFKL